MTVTTQLWIGFVLLPWQYHVLTGMCLMIVINLIVAFMRGR